jgi:hypothetical protein
VDEFPFMSVKQGDLADPRYFDFISFAQYATISNSMENGKLLFVERVGLGFPPLLAESVRPSYL